MKRRVVVVGHSDADGHAISEQTRRNLSLISTFRVEALVDPIKTRGHQAWLLLNDMPEIDKADIVFFVDLMFSPSAFVEQSEALVEFASNRPDKLFFVIDHHPLPLSRLSGSKNIHAIYRPNVFDCTFGPRSGLMILAAICEKQRSNVSAVSKSYHEVMALGLRRAAAPGSGLGGVRLMRLLKANRWDELYALGGDAASLHRTVRGRRISNQPESDVLKSATLAADGLQESIINQENGKSANADDRREAVPYDIELERFVHEGQEPQRLRNAPVASKDLEAIVTLLEVAALSLGGEPDTLFSLSDLIAQARDIGGDDITLEERDIKIVMEKANFLKKIGSEYCLV